MPPALESNPPEVVHVWGAGRSGVLTDWVQRRGTPTLLHALSTRDVERLKRRGLRANETAAGACEEFRETLRQRWPTPAQPIESLEPGLLVPEHPAGLSSDEHTLGVMWTGRIDNHSGLDVLIDAIAQLHRKEIDLQVALIGDGPNRRAVWQRLRRENVHDCVSLIDEPSLWPRALRGADALVVPNCQHTLALAPLAAMARGTIVIASRDQLADWFIEDRTSWEFNPGSSVELAYHLSRVAQRHPHARALSRTAAAYVRSEHTITDQAERLAALYARLASAAADEITVAPGVA
jgi:glycosyltransferase involved in cell wall biosynthesis